MGGDDDDSPRIIIGSVATYEDMLEDAYNQDADTDMGDYNNHIIEVTGGADGG